MEISSYIKIKDDYPFNERLLDFDPFEDDCVPRGGFSGNFSCVEEEEFERADQEPLPKMTPQEIGREGERLAASYLSARGYEILERNWRCQEGEIDIICKDEDGVVVLVEVKTRQAKSEDANLMPELSVTDQKQHKLARLALWYIVENPMVRAVRFDVIAINIIASSSARLRHLLGAFAWDE